MRSPRDIPILQIDRLAVAYETRYGDVAAVRDVSLDIHRAETFGIVGESGCGKSTVAFSIVNFLGRNGKITGGRILFQGQDLVKRSEKELRKLRGDRIAMVYQDPMQALNPSMTLGDQMAEVLIVHRGMKRAAALDRCEQMLERVYMPDPASVMRRYPHQVSGGQQQRIVIAMALLNDPALLIMDEPTTALDVTVEAAVLDLINDLQREFDTAIMYISHNLGVIARVSNTIAVMYAGEVVERASVQDIFLKPSHPYTLGLLRCVPRLDTTKDNTTLQPIRGRVPSPKALPPGCIFEPRCAFARPICARQPVEMREIAPGHWARCLFAEEVMAHQDEPPDERAGRPAEVQQPASEQKPILTITDAKTYYRAPSKHLIGGPKEYVKAVDGVSIKVVPGQTLGIVGESGCGKSTLVKTVIGLEKLTGGEMEFMGIDISNAVSKRSLSLIKELQMVFQNPDSTLNPSFSVGYQIARPLRRFKTVPRNQIRAEVVRLLDMMKLGENYYRRLPRQLSGGEKQRVGDRTGHRRAARSRVVRRAGVRAGCVGPGSGAEPAAGDPAEARHDHDLYRARSERGALLLRSSGGDVPRPDRGDRPGGGDLPAALSPVYRGAAVGRADPRSPRRAKAYPPERDGAKRAPPAERLPVPYALPPPPHPARRRRDLCCGVPAGAVRHAGAPHLLPYPAGNAAPDRAGGEDREGRFSCWLKTT